MQRGHANAQGDGHLLPLVAHAHQQGLDLAAQRLCHLQCAGAIGLGQHDDELLAPKPRNDVHTAALARRAHLGHGADHAVSG